MGHGLTTDIGHGFSFSSLCRTSSFISPIPSLMAFLTSCQETNEMSHHGIAKPMWWSHASCWDRRLNGNGTQTLTQTAVKFQQQRQKRRKGQSQRPRLDTVSHLQVSTALHSKPYSIFLLLSFNASISSHPRSQLLECAFAASMGFKLPSQWSSAPLQS